MKNLSFYKNTYGFDKPDLVFKEFMDSIRSSISSWDFFVDWGKVKESALRHNTELNILNALIGSPQIEKDFIEICNKYPEVKSVLPLLIAIRREKTIHMRVFDEIKVEEFDVNDVFAGNDSEKLLNFFINSGLKSLFEDRTVKNLVDYVIGVEVGMDTNARKNRTGTAMETIVEKILKEHLESKGYEYGIQMTPAKILEKWGVSVPSDKSERRFDFVVNAKGKLFMFEVNFYGGGGSKLKATAGEYIRLNNILKEAGFTLIWITDGAGWNSDHFHLEEAFNQNDFIFNLDMLNKGVLKEIL